MHALLRQFVASVEAEATGAGFVRRGPVFRYFDAAGNGIVFDIQRAGRLWGEVEFFVNAGVLLAPYLRYQLGEADPHRDAMPHHGVWWHRVVATDDTAELPDHRFSLSTEADADRAAAVVRTWLAGSLPRMMSWLGDFDAMLATIAQDREQSDRASEEQLASGQWKPGRWPDGHWYEGIIRVYAHADRGDVRAVEAEDSGPDSMRDHARAIAEQRRAERQE